MCKVDLTVDARDAERPLTVLDPAVEIGGEQALLTIEEFFNIRREHLKARAQRSQARKN